MLVRNTFVMLAAFCSAAVCAADPAKESTSVDSRFISRTVDAGGRENRYLVYVPEIYDSTTAWPLIVFLHGAGERGEDGFAQSQAGIGTAIRTNPDRFPAIVLLPQCAEKSDWAFHHDALDAELEAVRAEYNIDSRRIYLTGLSMGGYGTWLWGAIKTDLFAALMPICGGGDPDAIQAKIGAPNSNPYGSHASRVRALATVPIWAFHGGSDSVVPPENTRVMVEAVKAAGGNVKYTEYEGVDHNSWDRAYQEEKSIEWLLEQHK